MPRFSSTPTSPPGAVSRYLPAKTCSPVRLVARTCDNFLSHEMSIYAAALAYRGLLALFPFVIFVVGTVNALDQGRPFEMLADWARTGPQGRVPSAIKEWMALQARERADGAVLSIGAVAAVWAVASGARVLRRTLNLAADMPELHPAWKRLAWSLVAAPVLGAALLAAVGLFTVTHRILLRLAEWFALDDAVIALWDWIRLPVGVTLAGLVVSAVYCFASSYRRTFTSVLPGAAFATVVWTVASLIFSRAVAGMLQFGFTYGSFTAAIVLLLFFYLASAGLLLGAELNAVLMQKTQTNTPSADGR